jgi:hypothetical protein
MHTWICVSSALDIFRLPPAFFRFALPAVFFPFALPDAFSRFSRTVFVPPTASDLSRHACFSFFTVIASNFCS